VVTITIETEPFKIINKIRFGLLSPEEIRKMSVARIITADTYDEDGLPIQSGLMDPKLGTIEPGQKCSTCGNRVGSCPGHFGHIELARPVVHVGHSKLLLRVLRGICQDCARILLKEEEIQRFKQKQVDYIDIFEKADENLYLEIFKAARKNKECPYCGAQKKKIAIEKPTTYYEDGERLTPVEIRERLEKMNVDDCSLIGINPDTARPEWMILTVLPIPPVCVRPSITLDSGIRSEDDLTHKLVDVIRINQRLRENIDAGAPQLIVEDLWELLQYHVTTYFNNEVSGIPPARHRSGRALRTLTQRLKGKEGRFRSNLSGKRVDFSARTVISPNPHISINQVGVPKKVAQILTVPTFVTQYNIEEMKQLVLNGPKTHPGANYIIREDGRRIDLRFVKTRDLVANTIKPGFIIERHLKNGDLVLFNRQPSLHRMSIMAHEVLVMEGQTFRLSLVVCPPYNADFDGDEMNLHVPQSEEARTEAEYLLKVQEHIISPRTGKPIIGGIQDFISMSFLFTRKEIEPGVPNLISRKDAYAMLYWGNVFKRNPAFKIDDLPPTKETASLPKAEWKYWGKDIWSCILPHDLSMSMKSKFCKNCKKCEEENCPYDAYVKIVNGRMLSGVIDKNSFGDGRHTSFLQRIFRDYGPNRARQFLDDAVGMLLWVISTTGLTIGVDEVDVRSNRKLVHDKIYESFEEAHRKIKAYYEGDETELKALPGRTLKETLELELMRILNSARTQAGNIATDVLGDAAHSVIMTKSGARGSTLNLAQMAACVGQQAVRQERIHRGYILRTLPHFQINNLEPLARGFVMNSYRTGLTPTEFFFHAMGGREGLVDTAVRTSSSGYMQRRLVNALQDMVVENDLTVRTSEKNIIQFKYGDDGIDPGRSDAGKIIDLDAVILKTKFYKETLEKEKETVKDRVDAHPEFPVNFIMENYGIVSAAATERANRPAPIEQPVPAPVKAAVKPTPVEKVPEPVESVEIVEESKGKKASKAKKSAEPIKEPEVPKEIPAEPAPTKAPEPVEDTKSKKKTKGKEKVKEPVIEEVPAPAPEVPVTPPAPEPVSVSPEERKADLLKRSFASLSMDEKYELYNLETGKAALTRGRQSPAYVKWEKEKAQ
jgi:DNA-directed RNA polymerase subunit A'